jgi:hypothetical protein
MQSGEYKRIDRRFLDTFYRECGREVTLAYTVLNQTNTWAITFSAAAIAPLIALVKKQPSGEYTFDYPNPYYWLYLILVWGVLLRFLQRSALGLANMYRWNRLATATWELAALPEGDANYSQLNDSLVEMVDELMMRWGNPRPVPLIIWNTLKLLYLGPLIVVAVFVIWGLVARFLVQSVASGISNALRRAVIRPISRIMNCFGRPPKARRPAIHAKSSRPGIAIGATGGAANGR